MTTTNSSQSIDIRKLIVIILLSIVVAVIFDGLLVETWSSVTTIISIHAMLSFIAIICAGFILVQYRVRENSEDTVFHAALVYASIVNIGRVVRVTFDSTSINTYGEATAIVNELVYLAIFSLLIILGVVMKKNDWIKSRLYSSLMLIAGGLALHSFMLFFVIPFIPTNFLIPVGVIIGLIPSVLLPVSGIMWVRVKSQEGMFDLTYLTAGFVVFGIAWLPFVVSLIFPVALWTLSFALMTFGLVLLCLSSGLPFLKRIGMKSEYAYFITLGITSLGILPVTITVLVNTFVLLPIIHNIQLFIVVHLGASLMAAVMAFLMFQYDKQKPAPKRRPIVSLFITWATIEFYQVTKAVLIPEEFLVLSIIPYLIGSIFLLVHIPYAIKWTGLTPDVQQAKPERVVIVAPIMFFILFISELIQQFIQSSPLGTSLEPLGNSLLLGTALLGMFAFVYHSSVQVKDGRGKVTVDVLTTGFLALWIIPSMIKAIFTEWTTGWWTSEIILLLAVLFGPAILGFLYLRELGRAAEEQKRATLFADLLLHDISNYHQALAFSIGLLEMGDAGFKAKEQAIRDANIELQRADQLIRNVRRLSMADQLIPERLTAVDLIPVLDEAYKLAARKSKKVDMKFHVDAPKGECNVRANALLKDVFLNLFDNSIQYSEQTPEINVTVENETQSREEWYSVTISDNARGIDPKRRARLFERYMEDAVGTGLGLSVVRTLVQAYGGTIEIEEKVTGDYTQGTIFKILLRKA
ncbi:MAG: HAMP domain-containing sensor histidine kinase [Candidatus Thorarchaeota archaeon]